jgi:hypothetical protein
VLDNTGSTRSLGATLDVVITHADTGCSNYVKIVDISLPDHRSRLWPISTIHETASDFTDRRITMSFRAYTVHFAAVPIGRSNVGNRRSGQPSMTLNSVVYRICLSSVLMPPATVRSWFDGDLPAARCLTRRLERAYAASCGSIANVDSLCTDAIEGLSVTIDEVSAVQHTAARPPTAPSAKRQCLFIRKD